LTAPALSLAYLEVLADQDPFVKNFLRRVTASNYEEFLDVLYDDLTLAIQKVEENPQDFEEESEDATTARLSLVLYGMQYRVHHNAQAGGNVDVTVELRRFKWIAEAKKFEDVGDMREGFLQLSTRYRAGMDSNGVLHGGMIGYLRRPNAAKAMSGWAEHVPTIDIVRDAAITACSRRGPLAFNSTHTHQDFGTPFRVWHNLVQLHFAPKDKSGRVAKRHKDKP
jgi:hypothetical protein